MATSTIPAVKANLVAQLSARPGLTGVQISYGPPLPNPQREYIWVGDVEGEQEFAAMAAPNQRHERYRLNIVVGVLREGTDSQAADERCFALMAELETQLRGDLTVNGAATQAAISAFRLTEFVSPDGANRTAQLITTVDCQAWI